MPEIAEVETVRNTLKLHILKRKIKEVKVFYSPIVLGDIKEFQTKLKDQTFIDVKRRGKWLLFETEDYFLASHLRMEGKYFLKSIQEPILKHEHVVFTFYDGITLRYHDTRKFGRMKVLEKTELESFSPIAKLGIEPLSKKLTKEYLYQKIHPLNKPLKSILLDQTIISGLGNIYVDEVLFDASLSPFLKGNLVTLEECHRICNSSKKIIKEAILKGGSTIRTYTSSLGVTGLFQLELCVHTKENMLCKRCQKAKIKKDKIGGRSTYYCPYCQKE